MEGGHTSASSVGDQQKDYDNKWSRLLHALGEGGHETLKALHSSRILIIGLKGLGAEIAKNLVLMGVQSLSICDEEATHIADLSTNFFLTEADVGKVRSSVCFEKLRELNERVKLDVVHTLSKELLVQYKVVIFTNNKSYDDLLEWTDCCHSNNIACIVADTWGLFAYAFVDLGAAWVVNDKNGESPMKGYIESITQDKEGLVTLWDEKLHNLEDGDTVVLSGVEGMASLNDKEIKVAVKSPFQFTIGDTSELPVCTKGGVFLQVKKPITMQFKPLKEMMKEKPRVFSQADTAVTMDWSKALESERYHLLLQSLLRFRQAHGGTLPQPCNQTHADEVLATIKELKNQFAQPEETQPATPEAPVDNKLELDIINGSSGDVAPMTAFIGGLVAQEVIKASTQRYTPIYQWFFFDAPECRPDSTPTPEDFAQNGTRYDGQIAVFGKALQQKIASLNTFVVGSGAIGCEMLKNLALMGVGTEGKITLTDIDTIEISNLNRQFLFREGDISKPKSQVAAAAVAKMNPNVKIDTLMTKVCSETEDVLNDKFWKSLDVVVTALDNLQARKYIDRRCLYFTKPMLDSGTQGTKGNTQVIIPHLTESYSASADPPQAAVAVCLLHQFPNSIEHCLQWARELLFEGYYVKDAEIVNNWIENAGYLQTMVPMTQMSAVRTIEKCLRSEKPQSLEDCVLWARGTFERHFNHSITRLLDTYPLDHKDTTGAPFWIGGKLPPTPTVFDVTKEDHIVWLAAAAYMRAYVFGLVPDEFRPLEWTSLVEKMKQSLDKYEPEPYSIYSTKVKSDESLNLAEKEELLAKLPDRASLGNWRMTPLKFEKDDDRNFHIDFIWTSANIRADEYKIKTVDRLNAKIIAGNIIPAIVTTTALVTGLVGLELYKTIQQKPFAAFRNTFVNLANSIFQSAEPIAPVKRKFGGEEFSDWDFIDIKRGDITLAAFLKHIKTKYKENVDAVLYGSLMLYTSFMNKQKAQARLPLPLSQVITEATGKPIPASASSLLLDITCTDEDDNDLPFTPSTRVFHKMRPSKKAAAVKRKAQADEGGEKGAEKQAE